MSFRRIATGVALALAGVVAAVGIGLLANTVSGDSVGLGAEPLSAGETLAPPGTTGDDGARDRRRELARERREQANEVRTTDAEDLGDLAAPTTTFEDEDHSGSGSDNSGSGSDDSGGDDSGKGRGRGRGRGGDDD